MLSCKVTLFVENDHCIMVVHAHSRADLYHEIAELCAAFDTDTGYQISAIKVDTIITDDN